MATPIEDAFAAWCREHGEAGLRVSHVVDAPAPGGRYMRPLWDVAVMVAHESSRDRTDALEIVQAWLRSFARGEGAPAVLPLLETAADELARADAAERVFHAKAFADAWLAGIDAVHGVTTVAHTRIDGPRLSVEIVGADSDVELRLPNQDVAHVLQRKYGQLHPDRVGTVEFVCASKDFGPGGPFDPFDPSMYLLGFRLPRYVPQPDPDVSCEAFDHAYWFAWRWCGTIDCEHKLFVDEYGFGYREEPRHIHVHRDDVSGELHLDEEEAAAAIQRRYRERHPDRDMVFVGEYCK